MKKLTLFTLFFSLLSFYGCKKDIIETQDEFNKAALLANLNDEIIIPRYVALYNSLDELKTKWEFFKTAPSQQSLDATRQTWLTSNIRFQSVKVFNFGPALVQGMVASFGTFPTDTSKILSNTLNTSVDLNSETNIDAVGFPAMEFLLYRTDALNLLSAQPELITYMDNLLNKMQNELDVVLNEWYTGYSTFFKQSVGTEATSAFSQLLNAFNLDFELAKNAKLGIPIGKQSLGIPQLQYEESPFAKKSLRLLEDNLIALNNVYHGVGENGNNGIGFDDYLVALEKNHEHAQITDRFNYSFVKLSNLSDDLGAEIQTNMFDLDELYVNMQALVVHLKTDMTSAFGVLITYQDNDGD